MIEHAIRPPGHVTDSIRDMERWRAKRAAKSLDNSTLDTAIAYMREYRSLIAFAGTLRGGVVNEVLHRGGNNQSLNILHPCDDDCLACLALKGPTPIE